MSGMTKPRTAEHGTNAGYQQHRREGEDACPACLNAHSAYAQAQRVANGATPRGPLKPHGTRSAYERERRHFAAGTGPEPCPACREANRLRKKADAPLS